MSREGLTSEQIQVLMNNILLVVVFSSPSNKTHVLTLCYLIYGITVQDMRDQVNQCIAM